MKFAGYLFQLFFLLAIFCCQKPPEDASLTAWSGKEDPVISEISLYDTLSQKTTAALSVNERSGVKATYPSGAYTCYFEYDTDADELLRLISREPFKRNSRGSDTIVRPMQSSFSLAGKRLLSSLEVNSAAFFWNINPDDYNYFECIKAPMRHTILINKTTGRILHRIEYQS